jgi:hypothetical protein
MACERERSEKLLTAKVAKNCREGRKEKPDPSTLCFFFAFFAAVLRELRG